MTKNISYRLQFLASARFTAGSLSNVINNLSERTHRIKYKYGHDTKRCGTFRVTFKDC